MMHLSTVYISIGLFHSNNSYTSLTMSHVKVIIKLDVQFQIQHIDFQVQLL